jgi:putative copper resistance protein D
VTPFAALVLARWLQFAALAFLLGAAIFAFYAPAASQIVWRAADSTRRGAARAAVAAALVAGVSAVGWAAAALAGIAGFDALIDGESWSSFFFETSFGGVWLARLALAATLLLVVLATRGGLFARNMSTALVAFLAAALFASQAWIGHPASLPGPERWIVTAAYAAHVLGAGVWLGGLVPLGRMMALARHGDPAHACFEETLQRFSLVGVSAVAAILVGGIVNAGVRFGSFSGFAASAWGRLLVFKIVLFLVMVSLATINRFALMPRLSRGDDAALTQFRRNIALEQACGLLVLLAAASLSGFAPPR